MSPEVLLRQFDVLADASNGVYKLRELILQLAMRGKLVPQDLSDEPASELLECIVAEKQRLFKDGKIPKPKPLPPVADDEVSFEVPEGWEWVRLGTIADQRLGKMLDKAKNKGSLYPYLRNTNVQWLRFDLSDIKQMRFQPDELEEYEVRVGDLLVCEGGEPGRGAVWNGSDSRMMFQKALHRVRPYCGVSAWYILYILRASAQSGALAEYFTGVTIKHMTGQSLARFVLPLPPLPEQRRIVAKVDELMALCDELEARQQRRVLLRTRLNCSALHHLTAATDDADIAEHWQRLHENFDLLYDTPETVAELRKGMLQLAVRGKLVPQDPSDEPASMLLEQIALDKQRLFREGKIAKPQPLINMDEVRFDLPAGWVWVRFGDATINRDSERVPLSSGIRAGRRGTYPYYGASGVIDYIDEYLFDETLLLIGEDGANLLLRSTPVAFFAEGKYWVNNHAHVIDGITLDLLRYVSVFINATDLAPYVTGTAQPKLNQAKLNSIPIALPPLAEQRRIVAKVDELMALCERLEARLTSAREKASHLTASVVHHVAAA